MAFKSSLPKNDGELLTKTECLHLFCEKLKIGKNSYYKYYRKYIKFKHYGQEVTINGQMVKRLPRIPRKIAVGLIHLLNDSYDAQTDPPVEKLEQYMAQTHVNAENA